MAFLRIRQRGGIRYFYVVESRRSSGTVRQTILEYLGRDPDQKRLRKALAYWGVKAKPGKGRG
jgi:hypothetical protein